MSDIHALSGAYAVDAVDDIERASFERHLAGCPSCRAEVESLRAASAALADDATTTPPPALRDAVLRDISRVRPLPPITVGGPVHRRKWFPALVAAVVLALVGVGGAVWQPWRDDSSVTVSVADQVLQDPAAQRFTKDLGGGVTATVVRSAKLNRAVIVTENMPARAGREGLPALAADAQPAHELGRPDAGRRRHGAVRGRRRRRRRGRGLARAGRRVRAADQGRRPDRLRGLTMGGTKPRRLAVVGSGVAGLTAAYVAASSDDVRVTLYEADDRLGGHADTHDVEGPDGPLAIDTGFIVHNERTYPTLLRIFAELGVATQPSEMSMSTRDDATGLEWAGALGAGGLFPTWRNAARPAYLRMLTEIPRFHRAARALLAAARRRHDAARRSSRRTASRRTSPATSWSPSSRPSGPATRRSRWTTRRGTCSPSSTTTACSASSARRRGRR